MDWGKAKTILIVLFIFLNLFLFMVNMNGAFKEGISDQYIKNALTVLQARNIQIAESVDFNKNIKSMGMIIYEGEAVTKSSVPVMLKNISFPPKKREMESVFHQIKSVIGVRNKVFVLDYYEYHENSKQIKVFLHEKWQNKIIFMNRIELVINEDGTGTANYWYKNVLKLKQSHSNSILSAYQILLNSSQIESGSVVEAINFGFLPMKEEAIYDDPVWQVRLSKGEPIFLSAYDGRPVKVRIEKD